MCSSDHWLRGASFRKTNTISPTFKSFFWLFQFLREFKLGIHSFNKRRQNCLINSCTRRHLFLKLNWVSSIESEANVPPIFLCKKWFGVNGTLSAGCDDWYVNGVLLLKPSAPTKVVKSYSSLISAFPNLFLIAFFDCCDHYFINSTKIWSCQRIEWLLNSFVCYCLVDLLLIRLIHQIFQFFIWFHKITSIVKHYFRNTS